MATEYKFITLFEGQLKINLPELTNGLGWTLVSVCPFEDQDMVQDGETEYLQNVRKFFVTLKREQHDA